MRESNHQLRQQEASDRNSWRSSVRTASGKFEAERQEAAKEVSSWILTSHQPRRVTSIRTIRRKRKTQGAEGASSLPVILSPSFRQSKVQQGLAHPEPGFTLGTDEHARTDPQLSQILIREEAAIIHTGAWRKKKKRNKVEPLSRSTGRCVGADSLVEVGFWKYGSLFETDRADAVCISSELASSLLEMRCLGRSAVIPVMRNRCWRRRMVE